MHLFVRLVGREVAVNLTVDEVYLDVRIVFRGFVVVVADVGQTVVVIVVVDHIEAVLQCITHCIWVASVEITSNLAGVPGNDLEGYGYILRNATDGYDLLAVRVPLTATTCWLCAGMLIPVTPESWS